MDSPQHFSIIVCISSTVVSIQVLFVTLRNIWNVMCDWLPFPSTLEMPPFLSFLHFPPFPLPSLSPFLSPWLLSLTSNQCSHLITWLSQAHAGEPSLIRDFWHIWNIPSSLPYTYSNDGSATTLYFHWNGKDYTGCVRQRSGVLGVILEFS